MRRYLVAIIVFATAGSAAHADYLFMQYTMRFRRPPQGQTAPSPVPAGPTQPSDTDENIITLFVNTVVEGEFRAFQNPLTAQVKASFKHKWGVTNLYNDDQMSSALKKYPSLKTRFNAKQESLNKTSRPPEKVYDLAEWCLNHGLANEFATIMDGYAKTGKSTGLDKLDRAVETYTKVKADLAKRIDREDLTNYWRGKTGYRLSQSDHYSVLYSAPLADPPEVERRLKLLEENLKGVYYWFAFRGIQLPIPTDKLVVVLLDQPEQFKLQRALIEDEPLVTDGFFSARDNVVVLSTQRLDDASVLFGRQMQGLYGQGWDRTALLKGTRASKLAGKSIDEEYRMQTMALLDAGLEEEGEWAAVSHEATRQIFVASGLQKRTVIFPDYLQFGMASVFETPKGPYPFAPVEVRVPYWRGWGGPSWAYTRIFQEIEKGGLAHDLPTPIRSATDITSASNLLRQVVTDADFSRARDLGPRAGARHLIVARTYAWGLCYFLAKSRPTGVIRLYDELNKMPRDLELEPGELLACFCRAFDLANTTGTGPDPIKFEEFAKNWLGFMRTINTPGSDIQLGLVGPTIPTGPGAGGGDPGAGPTGPGTGKGKGKGKG